MEPSEATIVGVVLGAGKSSRFGTPKQLLPFGDTTLLGQAVRNANASALDRVVVVLGRASEELRATVDFGRAEVVENTAYGTGCASSLLAGLDAAGQDCDAIALLLGDQPGVRAEFIDHVIATWRQKRPWAAVTAYNASPLPTPYSPLPVTRASVRLRQGSFRGVAFLTRGQGGVEVDRGPPGAGFAGRDRSSPAARRG